MRSSLEVGTHVSALRYHVEMVAIPTRGRPPLIPVLWTAASQGQGEAAEATVGTPLLKGQGAQDPEGWHSGGEAPPETTIIAPSLLLPPAAGFPREPRTHAQP